MYYFKELLIYNKCTYAGTVAETVKCVAKNLCDQYEENRFTNSEEDWPPHQPKQYTNVTINKMGPKKAYKTIKLANAGKIVPQLLKITSKSLLDNRNYSQSELYKNTTKDLSDLFTSTLDESRFICPNKILIEGAPGIGKTVLSKEIAYQWAKCNILCSKKLLFLVFLRNFPSDEIQSVDDFVCRLYCKHAETAAKIAKYIANNNGKDVAIVLDGYDELSEQYRKASFIADIIYRRVLSRCLLVITSRATASLHLHDRVDCIVEIAGFTEEDRQDYIKTALSDSEERIAEVQRYLQDNPTINALCYIPLNMTILLCLTESSIEDLPTTQTEMYERFIKITIKRFLQKSGVPIDCITEFTELPREHGQVFIELARFAFDALKCDKLVFTIAELKKICPNLIKDDKNWNGLGLLNSVRKFEGVTYHFLHFSIQEYMAAYHITTLSDTKQIELLQNTFWTVRYYNTWIMYAGITGGDKCAFKHFLSGNRLIISTKLRRACIINEKILRNKIKSLHLFQCLLETKNRSNISLFRSLFQDQVIDLSNQPLSSDDLNTLGFFLIRSINKRWKKLNLSGCNIGMTGLDILSQRFSNKRTMFIVNINSVDFSNNQLFFSSLQDLFDLLRSWHTSEFIITDNDVVSSNKISDLLASIENIVCHASESSPLKVICIGSFMFAYRVEQHHMVEVLSNVQVETLYLLNCTLSCVNDLFSLQRLKYIHILDTHITTNFTSAARNLLLRNDGSIPSLFIYDSTLPDRFADEIGRLIMTTNLTGIRLIVSNTKVQGIINTISLKNQLSNLEILNLLIKLRLLCSKNVESVTSWRNDLQIYDDVSVNIIHYFTQLMFENSCIHLKINLIEGTTLFLYNIRYEEVVNKMSLNSKLKAIYLSSCELTDVDYEQILTSYQTSLLTLYLVNSCLKLEFLYTMLSKNACRVHELFLHSNYIVTNTSIETLMSFCQYSSVVLLTRDTLAVHNATNKQIALALQLEPSITTWKFYNNQFCVESF